MSTLLTGRVATLLKPAWRHARMCHRYKTSTVPRQQPRRLFHDSRSLSIVKPYLLADIGEGIISCSQSKNM